ncbi:MAG: hypothetical protein KatS3mg082_3375 [Nitrospiraceae bacterium]|nr:MAG: hypothetical protein KatS3mg051_1840 [Anaerolineae bacterium]GIW56971.1 MAG: hypothetical protein KatS3mg082_3375 [Nitrospiraceae bacterium]
MTKTTSYEEIYELLADELQAAGVTVGFNTLMRQGMRLLPTLTDPDPDYLRRMVRDYVDFIAKSRGLYGGPHALEQYCTIERSLDVPLPFRDVYMWLRDLGSDITEQRRIADEFFMTVGNLQHNRPGALAGLVARDNAVTLFGHRSIFTARFNPPRRYHPTVEYWQAPGTYDFEKESAVLSHLQSLAKEGAFIPIKLSTRARSKFYQADIF